MRSRDTKHIFAVWNKLKTALHGKHIYLLLDYDGTLSAIKKIPGKARLSARAKELLKILSLKSGCAVAIISGRSLEDIKKRVGLENIIYIGNHGFEIEGPKIKFVSPVTIKYNLALKRIKAVLQEKLAPFKGALLEDKGISLSVHYRRVKENKLPLLKTIFQESVAVAEIKGEIKTRPGKKILEIRPPADWDKGKAALWLLVRQKFALKNKKNAVLPIYIGDDTTDEDAFKVLKNKGITIFVGKPVNTNAAFYLKDTKEVARFLGLVLKEAG